MPSTITLEVLSWDRERRRTQNPCDAPASITIEAGRTGFGVSERHARSWHFDHFVETCWDPGFTRVGLVLELGEEDLRLLPEGFPVVTVNDQQVQGSDGRPHSLPAGEKRPPLREVRLSVGDVISVAWTRFQVR